MVGVTCSIMKAMATVGHQTWQGRCSTSESMDIVDVKVVACHVAREEGLN